MTLPCYVLEDGTRVLTQTGTAESLGISKFQQLPKFTSNKALKPFISEDLNNFIINPIEFKLPSTGRPAKGHKATVLDVS